MDVTYNEDKRTKTLRERGLDFKDAAIVFSGPYTQTVDDRFDYGEVRYLTIGKLHRTIVMVVWTERDATRRIISMRRCDAQERKLYKEATLDRSG